MLWSEKRGGRTGRSGSDARLLARGCGLKADTEPCGTRFSSRCCSRESEMLRAALTDCLLSYGSMARGAMSYVRRNVVCGKSRTWVVARKALHHAGHHVRAKIARGAEASSRSEGLAYARSERSVEP